MTKVHRDALRGEIASLRGLLDRSAGSDPLGSRSLYKRLRSLEDELAKLEAHTTLTASVALIFDGAAVRGSSAIEADFAGKALLDYQELVAKHVAVSEGGLAERGRLPDQVHNQAKLTITGLVHGSFGFVLKEDDYDQLGMFETPACQAVRSVSDLLRVVSDSSNEFDERLPELDGRIFQTLKRFVSHLHRAQSTLRLAEEKTELKLDKVRLERAFERVSQTEIEEIETVIDGELLGLVPLQRRFEFRKSSDGEVIQGRVAPTLSADYLERIDEEGVLAGGAWVATVRTKVVHYPDGRHASTRHLLMDLVAR